MKKSFLLLFLLSVLLACNTKQVAKPVWVNTTDTLRIPGQKLQFVAAGKDWEAALYTILQPLVLSTSYGNDRLVVSTHIVRGTFEGPGQIRLTTKGRSFFYPVYVVNRDTTAGAVRNFISPKTLNIDSSLEQQIISYVTDQYRNLLPLTAAATFFAETTRTLPPKVGIYKLKEGDNLTSSYVQPGSATSIPLTASYQRETNSFRIVAGPLKDRYNNLVADGTLVTFIYRDSLQTFHTEATVLQGMVSISIPKRNKATYTLKARINDIYSNPINLLQ